MMFYMLSHPCQPRGRGCLRSLRVSSLGRRPSIARSCFPSSVANREASLGDLTLAGWASKAIPSRGKMIKPGDVAPRWIARPDSHTTLMVSCAAVTSPPELAVAGPLAAALGVRIKNQTFRFNARESKEPRSKLWGMNPFKIAGDK